MPLELFKTMQGNEIAVAIFTAVVVTIFMVMTGGNGKKIVVNPGTCLCRWLS